MKRVYVVTNSDYPKQMILACENRDDAVECAKLYNTTDIENHVQMLPLVTSETVISNEGR